MQCNIEAYLVDALVGRAALACTLAKSMLLGSWALSQGL